jgi:diguanylate cyclase (GGDEF)-like protein
MSRLDAAQEQGAGAMFCLAYLDLDGFKPINDRYGHDAGDEVLVVISCRLQSLVEGCGVIGRHGGDEFMLLLDLYEQRDLERFASSVLEHIEQPIDIGRGFVSVSGSIGFAIYPAHGNDLLSLKKAADSAMYTAKQSSKGWVSC